MPVRERRNHFTKTVEIENRREKKVEGKKHRLWPLAVTLVIVLLGASAALVADYKSTFLINGAEYSTLSWLAPDKSEEAWTAATINKLINNGDTHADVMGRSTAKDFGYVNGVDRNYWRQRLNRLRDSGIQPVMWLISDDSPDVYAKGLQNQIDYNNQVVDAVDDLVSHYVACLECDEYYSPQEVGVLIQNLRKKGVNKPIGVHLTPHMFASQDTKSLQAYFKDADVIYLQTGWANKIGEAEFRRRIEYALTLGKPVVVSEYSLEGTTAEARRYGDIACGYKGVVGTGNGRGAAVCESLAGSQTGDRKKKDEWERISQRLKKNEAELAMFAVLLIAWQDNFGRELPFMTKFNWATEDGFEVMFARELTPELATGVTIRNDGRTMGFIGGTFGKLFGRKNHAQESEREWWALPDAK